ncbi:MAG: zinc ribbon domain-containing protein [Gemmatimonadota bacterium]
MTTISQPTSACPACGTPGTGNFCRSCGAAIAARACASCRSPVPATARFCPQCGIAVAPGPGSSGTGARRDNTPWIIGGVLAASLLLAIVVAAVRSRPPAGGGSAAAAGPVAGDDGGAPPDITGLSPRERFDRLYRRVMKATETGDMATAERFMPMALAAYAQLDGVDADTRYHAALLKLHSGDVPGAKALADSILAEHPGHLFGYVVAGTAGRWSKDDRALAAAQKGFLEHYDAEMKAGRPEYREHQRALDEFKQVAEAGK